MESGLPASRDLGTKARLVPGSENKNRSARPDTVKYDQPIHLSGEFNV
ncbi:hypothetical protein HMPREF9374_2941 [Desmospora sp. 8437]|nr:hypothetical protein HMPREF9374_2941 [Desmospora sp. 8437]